MTRAWPISAGGAQCGFTVQPPSQRGLDPQFVNRTREIRAGCSDLHLHLPGRNRAAAGTIRTAGARSLPGELQGIHYTAGSSWRGLANWPRSGRGTIRTAGARSIPGEFQGFHQAAPAGALCPSAPQPIGWSSGSEAGPSGLQARESPEEDEPLRAYLVNFKASITPVGGDWPIGSYPDELRLAFYKGAAESSP
ncbi:uncharacterized protein LOC144108051 [Amblyomma americanum]